MELDKALSRISEIHAHVARGEVFRGYRASTVASMGALALLGALLQVRAIGPDDGRGFVVLWVGIAGVCGVVAAVDLALQGLRIGAQARTWTVLCQYLPSAVVGGVLAWSLGDDLTTVALLPGLRSVVHGLGIFASRPYLPRAIGLVALWFVGCGAFLLWTVPSDPTEVPSAWAMGTAFGVGQAALAWVLHIDLERPRGKLR